MVKTLNYTLRFLKMYSIVSVCIEGKEERLEMRVGRGQVRQALFSLVRRLEFLWKVSECC